MIVMDLMTWVVTTFHVGIVNKTTICAVTTLITKSFFNGGFSVLPSFFSLLQIVINPPRDNHTQHRGHSNHPKEHHPAPHTPQHIPPPAPTDVIACLDPPVQEAEHGRDSNTDVKRQIHLVRPYNNIRDQRRQARKIGKEKSECGFVGVGGAGVRVRLETHDELDLGRWGGECCSELQWL